MLPQPRRATAARGAWGKIADPRVKPEGDEESEENPNWGEGRAVSA